MEFIEVIATIFVVISTGITYAITPTATKTEKARAIGAMALGIIGPILFLAASHRWITFGH